MALESEPVDPIWHPNSIDVGRRRALIGLSGIVVSAMGVERAWAQGPGRCVLTPEAGEGPYYLDPKLLRSDITSGQPRCAPRAGTSSCTRGRLRDACQRPCRCVARRRDRPMLGLRQAERSWGHFHRTRCRESDACAARSSPMRRATCSSVCDFPELCGGRTPHVHFKVFLANKEVVASQIFFPDEINKEVFAEWQPYREHVSKRRTFNDNDPIKQGVYSEVARQRRSCAAKAVLVVASR